MANMDASFRSDVSGAVQKTVVEKRGLMLLITDKDKSETQDWINRMILGNPDLSQYSRTLVDKFFVRLQIVKDSADFSNLVAVIPGFKDAISPSLFFIYQGVVLDTLLAEHSPMDMDAKIRNVYTRIVQSRQTQDATVVSKEIEEARKVNSNADKSGTTGKKTLKQESEMVAAAKHKEKCYKQAIQARNDRFRILKLMQNDREEQKQTEWLKSHLIKPVEEQHNIEVIHNPRFLNSTSCSIRIKHIDGTLETIRFNNTDTLETVREYLCQLDSKYLTLPFYFYQNIDRKTFTHEEETKTLISLGLNMSTLILKTIGYGDVAGETSPNSHSGSIDYGIFGKLKAFLFPSAPEPTYKPELLNDDNASDTDTIYHTPILSAANTISSNPRSELRHNVSNFNLYQAGIVSANASRNDGLNKITVDTEDSTKSSSFGSDSKSDFGETDNLGSASLQYVPEDQS